VTNVPWFFPGVAISLVLGVLGARPAARLLGASGPVAGLLLASVGVIVAATLTPFRDAFLPGTIQPMPCDFSRMGLAPLVELTSRNDTSLNVLLFVPLGAALGLIPNSLRKLLVLMFALALPFVIELTQLGVPLLARGCQSADVIDNLTGLVVGLAVATPAGWLLRTLQPPRGSAPPP
jgi:hypothetical protein